MINLAFVHNKGGTGKTTACLNIAGWLVKSGKKVLVIDLDPQSSATSGLGLKRDLLDGSLYDALTGSMNLTDCIYETPSGVYVMPSSTELITLESQWNRDGESLELLQNKLAEIEDYFDFTLIDSPPGIPFLMMMGIVAAGNLVIPIDKGVFAYEALQTLWEILNELQSSMGIELNVLMVLIRDNGPLGFRGPTKDIMELTRDFLVKKKLADTEIRHIPFSSRVWKAQMKGIPVSHFAPCTRVGRAFQLIADNLRKEEELVLTSA